MQRSMQYLPKIQPRKHIRICFIGIFIIASVLFTIYHIYKTAKLNKYVVIHWDAVMQNITCHYLNSDDALPSTEDVNFAPGSTSIFFHETSCRGGLDSRQACAVESAARAHPSWQVYVLFSSPVSEYILNRSCIAKLLEFDNIKMARVHIGQYCKGTAVEPFVRDYLNNSKWQHSQHPIEYTSNVLSFVSLNKWGGVYLDLDTIVTRSLDSLPSNWIVKLSPLAVATGIMAFSKDHIGSFITNMVLRRISSPSNPANVFASVADNMYKAITDFCPGILNSPEQLGNNCHGLSIFSCEMFYPISSEFYFVYYDARDLPIVNLPYTHHMWNELGKDSIVETSSPYARLAKQYCPDIYEIYGHNFGI